MAGGEEGLPAAEGRTAGLIAVVGAVATAGTWHIWGSRAAAGLAAGAILSWVNYRWMKQGVDTLARLSTAQAGTQRAQVPASVYLKFLGRYALLIVAAYAILRAFRPPVASLLAGFFSVVAAVLVEMVGQLFRRSSPPDASS